MPMLPWEGGIDWKKVGGKFCCFYNFPRGVAQSPCALCLTCSLRRPANPAPDHASQWGISQVTDMFHIQAPWVPQPQCPGIVCPVFSYEEWAFMPCQREVARESGLSLPGPLALCCPVER